MATLNNNFLATLSPNQRKEIDRIATLKQLTNHEMLLNANTTLSNVFIINTGRIKIYEISDKGKETILWFCFSGEIFGLADLNKNNDRKIYAESCGKTELFTINSNDFSTFLSSHHTISMYLIDLLSQRLQFLAEQLLSRSSDDVTTRLLKLLNKLSINYGQPYEKNLLITVKLTHQELADMIGASRQTITSTITNLKKSGHIDNHNGLICLLKNHHRTKAYNYNQ